MDETSHRFEFRGRAGEWFGIWIVNLLLSICTFGIYSAWAKVRRNKYFYNNTFVGDRNFDYHATGKQILIGRIIVVVAYVLFSLLSSVNPYVGLGMVVLLAVVFPWLLVRSIKFNARMSSFSNVRFDFHGKPLRAFFVYMLLPILAYALVGGLAVGGGYLIFNQELLIPGASLLVLAFGVFAMTLPVVDRAIKQFTISNHALGTSQMDMQAPLKPFVLALAASTAWVIGVSVVGLLVTGASLFGMTRIFTDPDVDPTVLLPFIGMFYVFFFAALLPASAIYQALTRNAVYNATLLGDGHRFTSNVNPFRLFWIIMSNAVLVICTLGLMLPWAQVRMANYLANHTVAIPSGSLDDFVGEVMPEGSAIGDAYTDLEAVDIGLPI